MHDIGNLGRRGFLLAAGIGAAVAATRTEREQPDVAKKAPAEPLPGYRASPHVLKYYRTTET